MNMLGGDLEADTEEHIKDESSSYPLMIAAGLLVVLMICAAGFNIWTLHERIDRQVRSSLEKLSAVIADQTSRSFQSVDLVLNDLVGRISEEAYASSDAFRAGYKGQEKQRLIVDKAFGLPQVRNLAVIDAAGEVLNSSRTSPAPVSSFADREYFRHLRDTDSRDLFISKPARSPYDGEWTLALARRLNAADGSFLGVVVAAIGLKHFEQSFGSADLGEGGSIALVQRDGTMLARFPMLEILIGRRLVLGPVLENVQGAKRGVTALQLDLEGNVRYLSSSAVGGFPLSVLATITSDVVMRPWRSDAWILLIGALGAVGGMILLLVMLSRKIRRGHESELLLSRQNLKFAHSRRLLLDAQRIGKLGHWVGNPTGTHAVWSAQLFEIAGMPPAPEVQIQTMLALVHPDDLDNFVRTRSRARELGIKMIHENRWVRPDGELRWVRLEADPRKDANGEFLGTFGIVQDITERKNAEEAARRSQHLLVDAIESISQGFILYDKDDRFVLANSQYREMFPELSSLMRPGLSYEEILRSSFERGLLSQTNPRGLALDDWLASVMAWHRESNKPRELLYENGRWISLVDSRTSDGGTAGLRTDITDFKTIEAALNQRVADLEQVTIVLETQKLELETTTENLTAAKDAAEAASRAKSDFLAIMSHEIRTPMSGMVGMIDLLRDTPLTELQQRYAALAKESANGLLGVTNDILDFSKLEAGELKAESIDFDIEHLVSDAVLPMMAKARGQGLDIQTSLAAGLPKWLNGDPSRVRQIVLNLVNNAIKFTENGLIAISISHRDLDGAGVELRIEVADSGIGIPSDIQEKLFRPFVQADTSISRKYGGTGLGLAICKQLCTMMGGAIGVRSGYDQGSTFWFTVHCRAGVAPPVAVKAIEPVIGGGLFLRILVAEDSPIIAMLILSLLSKRSYSADVVGNGRLALEAVQHKSYDLVLMDIQMPEMDGISATKAIRALAGPERDVPIVALTANALVGQRESYLAAGMDDYVTKPIQPGTLYAAVDRCGQAGFRRAMRPQHEMTG